MFDQDPRTTYGYLLSELNKRQIGFVEVMRPDGEKSVNEHPSTPMEQFPDLVKFFREHFKGVLIGNQGYDPELAEKNLSEKLVDMVSFARLYITNPDLYERVSNGWPIETNQNMKHWFGGGAEGYTTYPGFNKTAL